MGPALRIVMHMGAVQRLAPFMLAALAAFAWSGSAWLLLAVAWGALMQLFVEYAMHRFLLHREPPREQGLFNALYRSHIGHHEFPSNPEFFTGEDHWYPVRFGLVAVILQALLLWPILGVGAAVLTAWIAVFLGSAGAFVFYEYCHTLAHLNVPKGRVGQAITHAHLRHHFNDHHANFHVSWGAGWIDRLFGTAYAKDRAQARFDRRTLMSLGMDPEDLRLVTARKAWGLPARPGRSTQDGRPARAGTSAAAGKTVTTD